MSGRKTFVGGDILLASEVQGFLQDQVVMVFDDAAARTTAIPTPSEGMVTYLKDKNTIEAFNGSAYVNVASVGSTGYRFVSTLYFTSNSTFTKATYPWLRAIRVKVQGAGGGGGGAAATGGSQVAVPSAGGGGAYAESFITDIAGLAASVTVTRGAGGLGGAAGNNAGGTGGASSFGALVSANGGDGGSQGGATSVTSFASPVAGSPTGVGDLVVAGGASSAVAQIRTDFIIALTSGGSHLGGSVTNSSSLSVDGTAGRLHGGGGCGAQNTASQSARAGGAGGNGIVIVELYA